jgi:hypothetical protein
MAREPIDPRFVAAALVLIAFACLGLWHVETGRWRPGPGGGPALVPWLAFWSILPAALVMLWAGLRRPEDARTEAVKLLPVAGAVIWGLVYFWMVRKLGLVVSTVLMLGVGMTVLAPRPLAAARIVVPVAVLCGAAFWVMFTQVAPVLQVRVLAF